ncbi:MAG: TCR/Tet family MFS transporter [Asticcacaulis sp.]
MSDDNRKKLKAAAPFILVTVFLDMLCIGIIIPVLPQLIKSFLGGSVSQAGMWTGIFGCAWGLAQFVFSPIQGGLSDHFGRRPVVLASNFGTGVDLVFMALAPNLWWLFIGRIVSGMTAASISTAYAYMSDVTEPDNRARVFGLMGAAFGVGFVIGPSLGGFLGDFGQHVPFLVQHGWGLRLPFFVAGALSLTNFMYGLFILPESLPPEKHKPFSIHSANPLGAVKFLARSGQVLRLSIMYLMIFFSQSVFPTAFVLYADYRFHWGPFQVAMCLAAVGVLSATVQAGLTGMIVKRIGERRAMFVGLICGAAAFLAYALAPTWQIFIAFLPVGAFWGLANPSIQALMTSKVDPKEQGALQGANTSLSSAANIVAPLVFGSLLSYVTRPGMPVVLSGAPFLLAAACMMLNMWLALGVNSSLKTVPAYEGG